MADITLTVGTDVSRDYSTLSACIADWDDSGIFSAADNLTVEIHNDGVITETSDIYMNTGGTIGLDDIVVTVASGDEHDGTAGSGVVIDMDDPAHIFSISPDRFAAIKIATLRVEKFEVDYSNALNGNFDNQFTVGNRNVPACACQMIVHDAYSTKAGAFVRFTSGTIFNCIFYNYNYPSNTHTCTIVGYGGYNGNFASNTLWNCGVYSTVVGQTRAINGVNIVHPERGRNNIHFIADNTTGSVVSFSNLAVEYCTTNQNDLTDASSTNNAVDTDYFVSTTAGSEDLKLKSGAPAIDDGFDQSSYGYNPSTYSAHIDVDVLGRDRVANGDTWDQGAHEFVSAGGGISIPVVYHHRQRNF